MKRYKLSRPEAKKKAVRDKTRAKNRDTSRRVSNIMHPIDESKKKKDDDDESGESIVAAVDRLPQEMLDDETLNHVNGDLDRLFRDHAPKLGRLMNNLKDPLTCPGKQAVYCPFKVSGGVNLLSKIMTMMDISHVVYSGDVDMTSRQRILNSYNDVSNDYGEKTKVFIFTDAAAEGISLKSVRGVHLVNENVDISHINQVIGRSIRFESHMRLRPSERVVTVFRYRLSAIDISPDEMVYEEGMRKAGLLNYLHEKIKTDWNATRF